ncbi:uncharacterized protein BO88DRAFT_258415 [Aspergillus vadensis CBS 113365]|uniref:Uncharacterized protein n=1 Tax=Aspergillus vadensis (strain CBS 113365 / IMI 142717 / IBT 24658) TaxID=1448311 RepID=A0A319BH95_ASPVC|nr:hypothetical protein BO88DRAFT_258415 [Aspergillus vadensis CBS 113365]PYH70230.1 hypothetical protein BO88DRAFT_258415 [Aspergillus vadensis CBS 113365]
MVRPLPPPHRIYPFGLRTRLCKVIPHTPYNGQYTSLLFASSTLVLVVLVVEYTLAKYVLLLLTQRGLDAPVFEIPNQVEFPTKNPIIATRTPSREQFWFQRN